MTKADEDSILSGEAKREIEIMLGSRDKSIHDALRHFYVMGYKQSMLEWHQSIVRNYNEVRRNERARKEK